MMKPATFKQIVNAIAWHEDVTTEEATRKAWEHGPILGTYVVLWKEAFERGTDWQAAKNNLVEAYQTQSNPLNIQT